MLKHTPFVQVEAATGGEDVVRLCGLTAVLAAAGIPLQKALPCPDLPDAQGTTSSQHAASMTASSSSSSILGPRDNEVPLNEAADQKQNLAGQEQHASAAELGADMRQRNQVGCSPTNRPLL